MKIEVKTLPNEPDKTYIWVVLENGQNLEIDVTEDAQVTINGEEVPKRVYQHTLD